MYSNRSYVIFNVVIRHLPAVTGSITVREIAGFKVGPGPSIVVHCGALEVHDDALIFEERPFFLPRRQRALRHSTVTPVKRGIVFFTKYNTATS